MGLKQPVASVEIDRVIAKGGYVKADLEVETAGSKKEWVNFCLRIRTDLLEGIDKDIENNIGLTKTAWILQAIQEKLRKSEW